MKYLKKFENTIFNVGDVVRCIDAPTGDMYMYNNFFIVKKSYEECGDHFLELEEIGNYGFWSRRFELVTPEEANKYKLDRDTNKFNL